MFAACRITRDDDVALIFYKTNCRIHVNAFTGENCRFRHSSTGYFFNSAFEIVVGGIERVANAPLLRKRKFVYVKVDKDRHVLIIGCHLTENETERRRADDYDIIAFFAVECFKHVVAHCDIFGEQRFFVAYAVGKSENVFERNRHEVSQQSVNVNTHGLHHVHAVFALFEIRADDHARTEFESAVFIRFTHESNRRMPRHNCVVFCHSREVAHIL